MLYEHLALCAVTLDIVGGPTVRWGHDMCLISPTEALLIGGQGDKLQFNKDSLWNLNMGILSVFEILFCSPTMTLLYI